LTPIWHCLQEDFERKLLRKKQAKKQANGKELNSEDTARLEYLKAKNKAAKQAAADADAGEEISFSQSGGASDESAAAEAVVGSADEARARLAMRGDQLDTLGDKTADLASAAGEFEAMCKELERKSR
jgi:hypothetical protein